VSDQPEASERTGAGSTTRRAELGAFLRARREALDPESVGFTRGKRRLTRGLRREEVAELAEIGVGWYSWLEQGRQINVSVEVLARVAQALRLTMEESVYVFGLAEKRTPVETAQLLSFDVPAGVRTALETFGGPATAVNGRFDVLAWNALAARIWGYEPGDDWRRLNHLWRMFRDPALRASVRNWEAVAANGVGVLRAMYAQYDEDPLFDELFSALRESPEFVRMWTSTQVGRPAEIPIELDVPDYGALELRSLRLISPALPGITLFFQTAADGASRAVLERLAPATG
jgi:transcriptional regulator with XRE-family HTH domain